WQAGPIEPRGREGEDLAAGRGDPDGMLVLGREGPVAGDGGPAVGEDFDVRLADVDHRLDGEDHAFAHFRAFVGLAVVQDVGRVMEQPADAVATEVPDDGATLGFGISLDRLADGTGAGAG